MELNNDRQITISAGNSRRDTNWRQVALPVSDFYERLRTPVRSVETVEEYLKLPKTQQDDLKDVGGFVGGQLNGGRRKAAAMVGRDLITLDFDAVPANGTDDLLDRLDDLHAGYAVYSTRKHMDRAPRLRVILPLDRTVQPDEYEAIARRAADLIGISMCDPTTFEAERLMYWPSCCSDSRYVFQYADRPFLNADAMLKMYADWTDFSSWPQVPGAVSYPRQSVTFAMPDKVLEGSRVTTMVQMLGSMQAKGISDEAIRAAVERENEVKCNPPLTDDELEQMVFPALRRWPKGTAPYTAGRRDEAEIRAIKAALEQMQPEGSREYSRDDKGNGRLFANLSRNILRFVPEKKMWFFYDANRGAWSEDTGSIKARQQAKLIADALNMYACQSISDETAKMEYLKFAGTWQKNRTRDIVLKEAETEIPAILAEFDGDPWLLNCLNGVLNLQTGEFREHSPDDLLTKVAEVEYQPDTHCARWEAFLDEITLGDKEN